MRVYIHNLYLSSQSDVTEAMVIADSQSPENTIQHKHYPANIYPTFILLFFYLYLLIIIIAEVQNILCQNRLKIHQLKGSTWKSNTSSIQFLIFKSV